MSQFLSGEAALQLMNASDTQDNKFNKFSSGTSYLVKVLGVSDLVQYYGYGIYNKTHSFVAKNPSVKNKNGHPVENLTPWDLASQYLYNPDEEYNSPTNSKSYSFKAKERYMMGFYDVMAGELIVVDVSKNQAQAIHGAIIKNKDRLGDLVFRLEKTGSSTSTVVSLSVTDNVANLLKMKAAGIEADTELTEKALENFANAPEEFDPQRFEGCVYEADEDEMIINLDKAGFDVSLIGLTVPEIKEEEEEGTTDGYEEDANDSSGDEEFLF